MSERNDDGKNPVIGFAGMLLMTAGFCASFARFELGFLLIIAGAVVLAYALFAGHLPFLGR